MESEVSQYKTHKPVDEVNYWAFQYNSETPLLTPPEEAPQHRPHHAQESTTVRGPAVYC